LAAILENYRAIPESAQVPVVEYLTRVALCAAIDRHVGRYVNVYGTGGMTSVAEGKDLTNIVAVIGTGGALVRLPGGRSTMNDMLIWRDPRVLLPSSATTTLLVDQFYIMAAVGAIADKYPDAAIKLMRQSLGI